MENGSRINFRLECPEDFLDSQYRSRIAFLNDMSPSFVESGEVRFLAHAHRHFSATEPNLFRKYIGEDTPENEQMIHQFGLLSEGLSRKDSELLTYGLHGASYLLGLYKYSAGLGEDHSPKKSLLAGAMTTATINEYTAITDHVFPGSEHHVLDIDTRSIRQVCKSGAARLTEGDCFQMPYIDSSFDIVQSDHLISYISDSSRNKSYDEICSSYFKNANRVLKPGGALIMVDRIMPDKYLLEYEMELIEDAIMHNKVSRGVAKVTNDYLDWFKGRLAGAGFEQVQFRPGYIFRSRRDLDRAIMLGNTWDINSKNTLQTGNTFLTLARKI